MWWIHVPFGLIQRESTIQCVSFGQKSVFFAVTSLSHRPHLMKMMSMTKNGDMKSSCELYGNAMVMHLNVRPKFNVQVQSFNNPLLTHILRLTKCALPMTKSQCTSAIIEWFVVGFTVYLRKKHSLWFGASKRTHIYSHKLTTVGEKNEWIALTDEWHTLPFCTTWFQNAASDRYF